MRLPSNRYKGSNPFASANSAACLAVATKGLTLIGASLFCFSFWLRSLFASSSGGRNDVALRFTSLTLRFACDESLRFRSKKTLLIEMPNGQFTVNNYRKFLYYTIIHCLLGSRNKMAHAHGASLFLFLLFGCAAFLFHLREDEMT